MSYLEGLHEAKRRIAQALDKKLNKLDLGWLGLTQLPEELLKLSHLKLLNLGSSFWDETDYDQIDDVESERLFAPNPLCPPILSRHFPELGMLSIRDCPIDDLSIVEQFPNLWMLDCSGTPVSDLRPLTTLEHLTSLDVSRTKVTDLQPLAELKNLKRLCVASTRVRDLVPLAQLKQLEIVICSGTKVQDLSPLANLRELRTLHISDTQVRDLKPLAKLLDLAMLLCDNSKVRDLGPLVHARLRTLDASNCSLKSIPLALLRSTTLHCLVLYKTVVPGVPPELLSRTPVESCLPRLVPFFAAAISEAFPPKYSPFRRKTSKSTEKRTRKGGTESKKLKRWFAPLANNADWPYVKLFWYIGLVDRESLIRGANVKGQRRLAAELRAILEPAGIECATDAKNLNRCFIIVESVFNQSPFVGELWPLNEEPHFRIGRHSRAKREGWNWTKRAYQAWFVLDQFFREVAVDSAVIRTLLKNAEARGKE